MKILVLTSRFPYPLEKGDKLRLYHQLRVLSKHHEIVLCAITDQPISEQDRKALEPVCSRIYLLQRTRWSILVNMLYAVFTGLPLQVAYFYSWKLHRAFDRILAQEQPDHLYCQLIRTALYAKDAGIPSTIDYMDSFSRWTTKLANHSSFFLKRKLLGLEAKRVQQFEEKVYNWFDHHTIISEQDAGSFEFRDSSGWSCVPNGVDTSFFKPVDPGEREMFDVAFIGNLGYYNNVEAAKFLVRSIMPAIWERNQDASLLLAGARPAKEILQMKGGKVKVSGWVDDIRDAYASARVVVAPIFLAVGQQNKILEAMAMGIPTVTTSQVNNTIRAQPGKAILIADDAGSFARQVCRLLEDLALRKTIGQNGLAHVLENYSWESAVKPLRKLIESGK